ncbi:NAD(P)/FAD-dependent oxidoreductase [Streptomyces sp. TR06-5]|uniref:NAD(P)/FAD-dependent oxidoreductase n=1 Tax=unclassified Streptomyces TaxID=2593676 RepID=UPI0039A241D0
MTRIVVVGASAAGLTTAESLRRRGHDGPLTLIGAEPHLPYDRPPLSKKVLTGEWAPERATLRGREHLLGLDVDLRLGQVARSLDTVRRRVRLESGDEVPYDRLVVATGVRPRRRPGSDLAGVHVLRTLDDALALRDELAAGPRVVVMGAGFLGTEVAAAARAYGLEVTLVDPAPVPLHRPFGERVGRLVASLHRRHGVRVRCGAGVAGLRGSRGRVEGVELSDGTVLPAEVVVQAVGSAPAVEWLRGSGLRLGDGVECDERCRAAAAVHAVGDVASWFHPGFGLRLRTEHRMNATEQAMSAAGDILGDSRPFAPVPFFWTDQYDVRIQAYGIFPPGAGFRLLGGDPADGRFTAAYDRRGRTVGVLGWNAPREVRRLRNLVTESSAPEPAAPAAAELRN